MHKPARSLYLHFLPGVYHEGFLDELECIAMRTFGSHRVFNMVSEEEHVMSIPHWHRWLGT